MNPLVPSHISALRESRRIWSAEEVLVIGAAALGCHLEMRWRGTADLDLCIVVESKTSHLPGPQDLGWEKERGTEHRWRTPEGTRVDVIIPTRDELSRSEMIWPGSGRRMSLVGFHFAFSTFLEVEMEPGLVVGIASLPAIVLLKMVAYLDRPAERERDLMDIVYIMDGFVGESDRRWDESIVSRQIAYEDVSPFILGREMAHDRNDRERDAILRFIDVIADETDPTGTLARIVRVAPPGWRDPETVLARFRAFRSGYDAA